jgi:ParB/RepB/Spo0J family partition protein
MKSFNIEEIPVGQIDFNPLNQSFYEALLDEKGDIIVASIQSLVASLDKSGQREPITVVAHDKRYRVISGNRRLAAAKVLKWTTLKAIVLPQVSLNEEKALIVSHNLTRQKSYAEKFAELQVYKNIFSFKDDDLAEEDVTISKDEKAGRGEITLKEVVSNIMNLRSTRLKELLFVQKHRPDLVKDIDDGKYSVHSAYTFVKQEQKQPEVTIPLKSVDPDFNLQYDSEHKYADAIIETFRKEVSLAKEKDAFSLVKLLRSAIAFHENKLNRMFAEQEKQSTRLFEKMDAALISNKFKVYSLSENGKETAVTVKFLEGKYGIRKDPSNGKYGREALRELRVMVLRRLLTDHLCPQIEIKSVRLDLKPYRLIKDYALEYFKLFSERYQLIKEMKSGRITPARRRQINRSIRQIDKQLRIYLRILGKITTPFDEVQSGNITVKASRRKSKKRK